MTHPAAKNLDDSFTTIYEALKMWARSQRCIRGHVIVVLEEVKRLEEQIEARQRAYDALISVTQEAQRQRDDYKDQLQRREEI